MTATYRKRVTVSAPAGTMNILSTLDGWERESHGVYIVTDPDWRDDVTNAFGATVTDVEDASSEPS